ncbi:MAG: hypothetical protein JO362_07705 [Streptomycetaceae bacterium]|nr:hypothetical protein [Streptomycetaceae bacterium]
MRNDFTPIETCEIDDAELDNVSGGVLDALPTISALPALPALPTKIPADFPTSFPADLPGNLPLGF